MSQTRKYKAFISYSHKDEKVVSKLHRRLEKYTLPKNTGRAERKLTPIFRDREDLAASSGLNDSIHEALTDAENLIVICSPNAVASQWVNEEILYFKTLGREDRIFTVIIDGEPYADSNSENVQTECLPQAVKYKLGPDGELSSVNAEPLAADFRPQGDGEKYGLLKLISGLTDLRLDDLIQRDLMRARHRLTLVTASAAAIILALGTLTWTAHTAQRAAYHAQQEADARRADAENLVEFMLSDLRGQLESYGRLDLMESVGDKAIEYYGQFSDSDLGLAENGRRARTLHFIGELQDALGKTTKADTYFLRSYDITKAGLEESPDNPDRILEHARSAYLRSVPLRREGKYADEIMFLEEYSRLANKFYEIESGSAESTITLALAKTNLGRVKFQLGDIKEARDNFQSANTLLEKVAQSDPDIKTYLSLAENLAWLGTTYHAEKNYKETYSIRRRQVSILTEQYKAHPNDFRVFEGLVYAELGLGGAAAYVEKYDEAVKAHRSVLSRADNALKIEPGREKMVRAKVAALLGILSTSLKIGDFVQYKTYRQQISVIQSQLGSVTSKEHKFWTSSLPAALAKYDESYSRGPEAEK